MVELVWGLTVVLLALGLRCDATPLDRARQHRAPRIPPEMRCPGWMKAATLAGRVTAQEKGVAQAQVKLQLFLGAKTIPLGSAVTDQNGSYSFSFLPPGAAGVLVEKAGLARSGVTLWLEPGLNAAPTIQLSPASELLGIVKNQITQQPMKGVLIQLKQAGALLKLQTSATTDEKGRFSLGELSRGHYSLRVTSDGFQPYVRPQLVVPRRQLMIQLIPTYSISGHLAGSRVARTDLRLRIGGSGIWPAKELPVHRDGSFLIQEVPAGIYELSAFSRQPPWVATKVITGIQVGLHPATKVVLELLAGAKIKGLVLGDDRPCPGAMISLSQSASGLLQQDVTSNQQGEFTFSAVPHGSYQLQVWAKGFLPLLRQELKVPGPQPLVLRLNRGLSIKGQLHDEDGYPIPKAQLFALYEQDQTSIISMSGPVFGELGVLPGPVPPIPPPGMILPSSAEDGYAPLSSTTNSSGEFTIAGLLPGKLRVVAEHPDFTTVRSDLLRLDPLKPSPLVALVMRPSLRFFGQVYDERGLPLQGAQLILIGSMGRQMTFTSASGDYSFTGLWGRITLTVQKSGYLPLTRQLSFARDQLSRSYDLVLRRGEAQLSGRVYDPQRLPIHGARIRARQGSLQLTSKTDHAGFFLLSGLDTKTVRLEVTHPDFTAARIQAAPNGRSELEIQLRYSVGLQGRVLDGLDAAPVRRYSIVVHGKDYSKKHQLSTKDGRFKLNGLPNGSLTIQVEAAGYAGQTMPVRIEEIQQAGALHRTELTFTLQRAGEIQGQVTDRQGYPVVGAVVEGPGTRTISDKHGNFQLRGVPEGTPRVVVTARGGQRLVSEPVVVRSREVSGPLRLIMPD